MATTTIPAETDTETTRPFTTADRVELGDRLALGPAAPYGNDPFAAVDVALAAEDRLHATSAGYAQAPWGVLR